MSLERDIGSRAQSDANGFIVDIKSIIDSLVYRHRDNLFDGVTRKVSQMAKETLNNTSDRGVAFEKIGEFINERVIEYYRCVREDAHKEIMSISEKYYDDYFSNRAVGHFKDIITSSSVVSSLTEDDLKRLMGLHQERFTEEFTNRVQSILEDGDAHILEATKDYKERVQNALISDWKS